MAETLKSTEPATGTEIWSGAIGDPAAEVAVARAASGEWAAHSVAYRSEAMRRFANVVRKRESEFATLISRETASRCGKRGPKVGPVATRSRSDRRYSERTPRASLRRQWAARWRCATSRTACWPSRAYNFPAHLPNGHIVRR